MIVAHRPIPLPISKRPSSHFRSDSRPSGRVNSQLPCSEAIPVYPPRRDSCLPRAPLAKGRESTKTAALTTFRINSCKSVSKQRTLTYDYSLDEVYGLCYLVLTMSISLTPSATYQALGLGFSLESCAIVA